MVIEGTRIGFWDWLLAAGVLWLGVMAALIVLAIYLSWQVLAIRRGPGKALHAVTGGIAGAWDDWRHTSLRRVMALTRLGWQESIRRRVVAVFVIFALLLLFAGWFLPAGGRQPAELYLSFVLTATNYLILAVAVILSTFSLPNDIRDRTIFTVVSKPVRRHEIVMGRTFGFVLTGTALLAAMGLASYGFVQVGLEHTHTIDPQTLESVEFPDETDPEPVVARGNTSMTDGHFHEVEVRRRADGSLYASTGEASSHWHPVTIEDVNGQAVYNVGGPADLLQARVPVYGTITYFDREGEESFNRFGQKAGINVGKEWSYRTCVEGATQSRAEWSFDGVTRDRFTQGLPLEMTLGVFRTYKGDIEQGILGQVTLRNPRTGVTSSPVYFVAREYYTQKLQIGQPRRDANGDVVLRDDGRPQIVVPGPGDKELNLFRDLIYDGQVELILKCEERSQFLCIAEPDVYLKADDAPFWLNFIKGHMSIWMQMVVVIAAGVFWSTVLRGPVALLATIGTTLAGFFSDFMMQIAIGDQQGGVLGGGPVEATLRILWQENLVTELQESATVNTAYVLDTFFQAFIGAAALMVPDFMALNDSDYVANGFNISADRLARHVLMTLAFLVPLIVAGHLCLRSREVAS